jgi:hypothetical protein
MFFKKSSLYKYKKNVSLRFGKLTILYNGDLYQSIYRLRF